MRPIACRPATAPFAPTPSYFPFLIDHNLNRRKAGAFVRAVAERLFLRAATGAPIIGAGFALHYEGGALGAFGLLVIHEYLKKDVRE